MLRPMSDPKQPTILVADDQPGLRMLLDMLLSLDGYEVVTVEDGKQVLEYLKSHTPSLMILDVNMPFVDGIDICRRVRGIERLKRVPVIILTASKDDGVMTAAKMAKASAVVNKPLEGKDFRALVRSLLPS